MSGVLSEGLSEAVGKSRVLVVGTGGIGCELLKNLVLTGFSDIALIDLDTIEVSNLNRQFLFRKEHVGRPKVEVARESALQFNPDARITARHDSILSPEYNVHFFKQFSLVMNALDNKVARNHVNRLCLAAGVTLVESGSAGYLGQVTVIRKRESECYECQPKPAPKTFPGCTIRNTPSEPIHCIVWAKHLFSQLFGEPDADNDVSPETEEEEMETEGEAMQNNTVQRISTRQWAENNSYDPVKLFHKLYQADIEYLLSMDKLWQTRSPPHPLLLEQLPQQQAPLESSGANLPDQRVWSVQECADAFLHCVRCTREEHKTKGELVWDKDDKVAMDFVAASANLRAFVFGIPLKSRFDIKSMAGNIIPAIATTNAVIAGLIVMEALKVLARDFSKCKTTYLPKYPNPRKRLLVTCSLAPPNPKCYVCSPKPEATVRLNVNSVTVWTLQEKVLREHFGMVAPDVEIEDGKGTILISSEEGETDENLQKRLSEFAIGHGSRLQADDFHQNYQLVLNIAHSEECLEEREFEVVVEEEENEEEGVVDLSTRKRKGPSSTEDTDSKRPRKDATL